MYCVCWCFTARANDYPLINACRRFGYSVADVVELLTHCPVSCNLCSSSRAPVVTTDPTTTENTIFQNDGVDATLERKQASTNASGNTAVISGLIVVLVVLLLVVVFVVIAFRRKENKPAEGNLNIFGTKPITTSLPPPPTRLVEEGDRDEDGVAYDRMRNSGDDTEMYMDVDGCQSTSGAALEEEVIPLDLLSSAYRPEANDAIPRNKDALDHSRVSRLVSELTSENSSTGLPREYMPREEFQQFESTVGIFCYLGRFIWQPVLCKTKRFHMCRHRNTDREQHTHTIRSEFFSHETSCSIYERCCVPVSRDQHRS